MLDGDALLDLYQRGRAGDALGRAALLGHAAAGAGAETLPLGELDRRIWALRTRLLADMARPVAGEAVCTCPACGARLEFTLPADFAPPPAVAQTVAVEWQGETHMLRLPCLADFGPQGLRLQALGTAPWHDPGFAALAAEALQAADPALGLTLAMDCPECGAALDEGFDPAAWLWAEIEEMARGLLNEVVRLARAFGWSEREILAMPPARRALYLSEVAP